MSIVTHCRICRKEHASGGCGEEEWREPVEFVNPITGSKHAPAGPACVDCAKRVRDRWFSMTSDLTRDQEVMLRQLIYEFCRVKAKNKPTSPQAPAEGD